MLKDELLSCVEVGENASIAYALLYNSLLLIGATFNLSGADPFIEKQTLEVVSMFPEAIDDDGNIYHVFAGFNSSDPFVKN